MILYLIKKDLTRLENIGSFMNVKDSVYSETSFFAFKKTVYVPSLRRATLKYYLSLFFNFFFFQHRQAFLPGRVPVSNVDHVLDKKIPFTPSWVKIYIDFAKYWIRLLSFILRRYGRKAYAPAGDFISGMADLYTFAAQVYRKNLSTTSRPFYIKRPLFMVIHMLDPHLMCIPSLHVMVVIYTYTMFVKIAKSFGEEEKLKDQILEMKYGALAIVEAILFVKQHSINCIAAALYAMNCYSNELFPMQEAEHFISLLFSKIPDFGVHTKTIHPSYAPKIKLPDAVQNEIREYILNLFECFVSERDPKKSWNEPLLNFLKTSLFQNSVIGKSSTVK
ncbi:MAG: hypothetical protein LBV17_04665 [Treponema sp.]|jgi:hypothetical protein|nr:hypothetical protein [Treponema sp.]